MLCYGVELRHLHFHVTWAKPIMKGFELNDLRLETRLEELEIEAHSTWIRVASHSHLYSYLSLFRPDDLLS